MSTQLSQLKSLEEFPVDFSLLKERTVFFVTLDTSYIANGKFIDKKEIEVLVADASELAERIRVSMPLRFDIRLSSRRELTGFVKATLGDGVIGKYDKKYLCVRLQLEEAYEHEMQERIPNWLT